MTNQIYSKQKTLRALNKQATLFLMSGTKQDKERATRTFEVIELIEKCNCNAFTIQHDNKQHINLGYILESLLLNALNLYKEDYNHEIKSLVNNTPNVLTNTNVNVVYVIIVKASRKGVYKYNAKDLLNKRLTLSVLNSIDSVYMEDLSQALGF
jgi:hypothetical protein